MKSILIYARPWNVKQFFDLAHGVWPRSKHISFSEHSTVDECGFTKRFYNELSSIGSDQSPEYLSAHELEDVIRRCRLLRSIDRSLAVRLVCSVERVIESILDEIRPAAILSVTVDSYILHLSVLSCRRRGIPFVGLVPSFVNGYFRLTQLGERIRCRQVSDAEVEDVAKQLLKSSYKPNFIPHSYDALRRKARRLWLRNLPKPLWFKAKRYFSNDVFNYHYLSTEIVSRSYWSYKLQTYRGASPSERSDIISSGSERSVVFLPLQMSPEATIDYWSDDINWVNYEERVLNLIDKNSGNVTFVVKEHPNLLGYRQPGFYRRLSMRHNCFLVAPEVTSNAMLDICDAVVICTGTVGFEAALRNIPVYSDSSPFHLDPNYIRPLSSLGASCIQKNSSNLFDQNIMVRYLLESLLPGSFINDGTWLSGYHDQSSVCRSLTEWVEQ